MSNPTPSDMDVSPLTAIPPRIVLLFTEARDGRDSLAKGAESSVAEHNYALNPTQEEDDAPVEFFHQQEESVGVATEISSQPTAHQTVTSSAQPCFFPVNPSMQGFATARGLGWGQFRWEFCCMSGSYTSQDDSKVESAGSISVPEWEFNSPHARVLQGIEGDGLIVQHWFSENQVDLEDVSKWIPLNKKGSAATFTDEHEKTFEGTARVFYRIKVADDLTPLQSAPSCAAADSLLPKTTDSERSKTSVFKSLTK